MRVTRSFVVDGPIPRAVPTELFGGVVLVANS